MLTTTKEPAAMDEAELEAHIKSCGQLMVDEHTAGNREAALGWLQAQQEAIRARRPEVVARMEQELMQRIHEPFQWTEIEGRRYA